MVNNDHTVTQAKLHLRECKNRPSLHPRVTHWDLTTHVSIGQFVKAQKKKKSNRTQTQQKLWVIRGYNNV